MLKYRCFIARLGKIAALTSRPPFTCSDSHLPVSTPLRSAQAQMQLHEPTSSEEHFSIIA